MNIFVNIIWRYKLLRFPINNIYNANDVVGKISFIWMKLSLIKIENFTKLAIVLVRESI